MLRCSFWLLIVPLYGYSSTDRLSIKQKDLSLVEKIYISPGLVSVIEFPHSIIEVRVGSPETLKVMISQVSPKEITVYLSTSAAKPTNLIVRSDRKIYVFDIVPSQTNHQDYVRISGHFSTPRTGNSLILTEKLEITSKSKNETPVKLKQKTDSVRVSL